MSDEDKTDTLDTEPTPSGNPLAKKIQRRDRINLERVKSKRSKELDAGKPRIKRKLTHKKIAKTLQMRVAGHSVTEIASALDTHPVTINDVLEQFKPFFAELDNIEPYQQVKGQLLNAVELKLLKSLVSDAAIDKAALNQRAYALGVVHKAGRLESGQSTSNQQVNQYITTTIRRND